MSADSRYRGIANLGMLLGGYAGALVRLGQAADDGQRTAIFRSVFEALGWAYSIDDRLRETWHPEGEKLDWAWRERVATTQPDVALMPALRFARNRVHHRWADIVVLSDGFAQGAGGPSNRSIGIWRNANELPAGPDAGKAEYVGLLEGQAVEPVLLKLGLVFEHVGQFLEPPRA